jgi:hypothetical protein
MHELQEGKLPPNSSNELVRCVFHTRVVVEEMQMMRISMTRCAHAVAILFVAMLAVQPARATLPTPNQPILVVQDSASADPYQNFVPELLTTEGLNGFQTAQLSDLTSTFLTSYDVVILPHLTLTASQVTLFQNYVSAGGTLVGFRPDLQLASVFGVASLGTTLQEAWLKIDTTTPYAPSLDSEALKFHGTADVYSLNGASALATLYNSPTLSTSSPAAAINGYFQGKAILFSFDLTQSIVLMRQGNPAWAGYPNNHDGYNTMRASQMFMDQGSGKFWNDLGDGALNDVPQADIQMRLFGNALTLTNAAKRPLPKLWYFPNQSRAMLLMTGDDHGFDVSKALGEVNNIASFGGLFSYNLWYPFTTVSNTQVNTWLTAGNTMAIHFNDTGEVDSSGAGGSAASWDGMQNVMSTALSSFAATYQVPPANAPNPVTTRNHYLIWVSNDADGTVDQVAQAKLFQNNGIQLDTSYSSFPNRWGYMTGSGLPMKFLDPVAGSLIPVYEQATQYEDDIQLGYAPWSTTWNISTAQSHYQQSLSASLNKYNTVITMLFHPESWSDYQSYADAALQFAQSQSIPISTTGNWLTFWQARAATALSMPTLSSGVLTFTATSSPAGLTLLVPFASGNNAGVSTFQVDGVSQSFTVAQYQGVMDASVVLTAGPHNISVTYTPAGRIRGQISPSTDASSTTIKVQGGSITQNVPVATDGTYVAGPLPSGTYTVTPVSSSYLFSPTSRSVTLSAADVTNVNFTGTSSYTGETLFTTQTPVLTNQTDGAGVNYELGTAFTSVVAGAITAVRFWKAPSESGTHIGKIWSSTGTLLAAVTFANETASGWQRQALSAPLSIAANTTYIVSVNTGNTYYAATGSGLAAQVVSGDLKSIVGSNGYNGVYGSPGTFPTNFFSNANYFRDIYFVPATTSILFSVSLNPADVTAGGSTTGTVTLGNPAPQGGTIVTLASDNAAATVPGSVTVAAGATTATFTVTTSFVSVPTTANILGSYNGFQAAPLSIHTQPPITSVSLNPASVTGGSSTTGSVTLSSAPLTLAVVALSATNPLAQPHVIQPVNYSGALQADGSIIWANLGPPYFNSVPTGSVVTVSGVPGLTATLTNKANQPLQFDIECPGDNCDWVGNFNPGADVLWDSGTYQHDGSWLGNGPLTVAFSSPQRGLGFQIMADENGPFTATMCAYDSSNALLGCAPFSGNSADAQAKFIGIYDDSQEISKVTIDAGGTFYPHDFGISDAFVVNGEKQLATVPVTAIVPAGSTTGTFTVTTNEVSSTTSLTISGNYNGTASVTLTLTPPVLSSIVMNANSVPGGTSSTGTVTLASPAPSGGAVVILTNDVPVAQAHTIQAVTYPTSLQANGSIVPSSLQADGSILWSTLGPTYFTTIASGTVLPVSGLPGLNVTLTNAAKLPLQYLTECPGFDCDWVGNFNPGADVLWDSGTYVKGNWVGNGPLTVAFSSPQRGLGFQVMADENGPFTATMCAYDSSNTQLGCASFKGLGSEFNQAIPIGLYDDTQEISKVTVDAGGALYPHDFGIGDLFVTSAARPVVAVVPSSVTVPAGQTTGTFTVTTNPINTSTFVNITGSYSGTQAIGTMQVTAVTPGISSVSFAPSSVGGGTTSTGTVTLTSPAITGGAVMALSSDNTVAMVPTTVTVAAHASTVKFTVNTTAVASATTAHITATSNGTTATGQLTVNP